MTKSIVVVEDDQGLQKYLRQLFSDNGFQVRVVGDGPPAIETITDLPPDLVILDLGLPTMSGETVCAEVKRKHPTLPIIMLTARDGTPNVIKGLSMGADDYITKPFVAEELLARTKARLRVGGDGGSVHKVADLELDAEKMIVKRSGQSISLTPQEFRLLEYLMANKGRVLTREMILNHVWMYSPEVESRVVDIYIGYLRKKIDKPFKQALLKAVRGFGYKITDEEE